MASVLLPAVLAGAAVASAQLPGAALLRLRALLPVPAGLPGRPAGGAVRARLLRRPLPGGLLLLVATAPVLGPGVALLLGGAAVALLRARAHRARRVDEHRERVAAVEACAALAAELRAGRTPAEALAVAAELGRHVDGPAQRALRAAAGACAWGGDVPGALLGPIGAGSCVPEVLRGLAACWQVCSRSGGGLSTAVDRLADGLRARQAQQRAVAAALAGPRASATLLALLPAGGVALAAGVGAHPLHVLLRTPLGLACLTAGLALDVSGLWWTGRLVARAQR